MDGSLKYIIDNWWKCLILLFGVATVLKIIGNPFAYVFHEIGDLVRDFGVEWDTSRVMVFISVVILLFTFLLCVFALVPDTSRWMARLLGMKPTDVGPGWFMTTTIIILVVWIVVVKIETRSVVSTLHFDRIIKGNTTQKTPRKNV